MSKLFSVEEVASHASRTDFYMIIHNQVYDASTFIEEHPGGEEILTDVAGRDATEEYDDAGQSEKANQILTRLCIGKIKHSGDLDFKTKALQRESGVPRYATSTRSLVYILAFLAGAVALKIMY